MAASSVIIERLNQTHDLSGFDCGNSQLNEWLKRFAWSNDRAESARTYTAHRANRVVGYHSLVAGSALKHETPARIAKGLANHPVGLILLARLAVDRGEQGKGLGKALLRDALARIAQAADLLASARFSSMRSTMARGVSICTKVSKNRRSIRSN